MALSVRLPAIVAGACAFALSVVALSHVAHAADTPDAAPTSTADGGAQTPAVTSSDAGPSPMNTAAAPPTAPAPSTAPSSVPSPSASHTTTTVDPVVGASAGANVTVPLTEETSRSRESTRARFHTLAELELGILALPFAPISPAQRGGDTFIGRIGRGDATILAGIRVLASTGKRWSVGAAARFAPKPTADSEYGGTGRLPRTHSRSYFTLGVEGRFIPLQFGDFDIWGGASVGAVIVADRFSTDAGDPVPPVLGDRNVTIATEGLSLGGQVGVHWNFADRWVMGTALRFDNWFLPQTSSCTPIGDCTTLQGAVVAFDLGLTIGYRVPL